MSKAQLEICVDRILRIDELAQHKIGVIDGSEDSERRSRLRMAILKDGKWTPGRTLRIAFLDGVPQVQDRVAKAASIWQEHVNLNLVFIKDPLAADIRISFNHPGSWSYLGNRAKMINSTLPTMNFGWLEPSLSDEVYHRVVLHEFGHAFGAIHEHQSPGGSIPWDEAAVLTYYMGDPNFWEEDQVRFNVLDTYSAESTNHTTFDRDSIMLYPIPAAHLTDTTAAVSWRNSELSTLDIKMMSRMYPGKSGDQPISLGQDVSADISSGGESDRFVFDVAPRSAGLYKVETHGSTDVVVSLFGPDDLDRFVARNDDAGVGLNSLIQVQLEAGRYLVVVTHFDPDATGSYGLRVDRLG